MKTNWPILSALLPSRLVRFVVGVLLLAAGPALRAGLPNNSSLVIYNPNTIQPIHSVLPVSWSYDLTITSPSALPLGTTSVTMQLQVMAMPANVTAATAASFVAFSPSTLTYTGPNQNAIVHVTFTELVGGPTGTFGYHISGAGWPSAITDRGTNINLTTTPGATLQPPVVAIGNPPNGTIYTYTLGGPPVSVSVQTTGIATQTAPVLTLTTELTGDDPKGVPIPAAVLSSMIGTPLDANGRLLVNLPFVGLGSPSATGSKTIPVNLPGTYTLTAVATNSIGPSVTTSQFIVQQIVPPPTVVINPPVNNPTYTYIRGMTSVQVPYTYTGTSLLGGIRTLTATLDGSPIAPTTISGVGGPGVGQLVATGSGTLTFNASTVNALGQHRIDVTATDDNGTASASATFVIAEQVPQISTVIGHPADAAVYYLPADASALNIPYDFTSSTTYGAPVTAIAATLTHDSNPANSVTIGTTGGLNTTVATGSGTFLNVAQGAYKFVATGTNAGLGLTASDTHLFTVVVPPPPIVGFTLAPGATYTALTGYALSIPVAIQTAHVDPTTGANIVSQSLTLDNQPVAGLVSANLNTLTATGTATVSVSVPAAGATTHTLIANGVDAFGRPATATTTFTVTVTDPVITIAIAAPANNSVYTMPAGGSLSIPFSFAGDITAGATVDTITGNLGGSSNVTISSSTGLGTANHATGSGTLIITSPGTYTLTATDTNTKSGRSATTSVSFTVNPGAALPPLSVAIAQAPLPSYNLLCGGTPLSIPVIFVGQSTAPGAVSTLTATLDGSPVTLSSLAGINTLTATGQATLSVNTTGQHILAVKDTDPYGQTATASASFVVVAQSPAITIVINAPANNGVYLLPCGSGGSGSGDSGSGDDHSGDRKSGDSGSGDDHSGDRKSSDSGSGDDHSGSHKSGDSGSGDDHSGDRKSSDSGSGDDHSGSHKSGDSGSGDDHSGDRKSSDSGSGDDHSGDDGSGGSGSGSSPSLSIPFTFTANITAGATIDGLSASLNGSAVTVTKGGLGTAAATGSGTLTVAGAGTYTLSVTATDNGCPVSATTTVTFTVRKANPPIVRISQPTQTSYTSSGCSALSIPFVFTGISECGGISNLSASLDGQCLVVTSSGLGQLTATGTGTLGVKSAGLHKLTVSAKDPNGTALSTFAFNVIVQNPTPAVAISKPAPGAVFSYTEGAPTPAIPFVITATTNSGATISTLKATLNGRTVTVANSGIGTNTATGTGTLTVCGPGSYTLSATTTSGCVNASSTVAFTVKKNPAPTRSIEWEGSVSDGTAKTGGSSVPVACEVKLTSGDGSRTTVRDSSLQFSVFEVRRDGSYGAETIYGPSDYAIDGSNRYNLNLPTSAGSHRYHIDAYCFPGGGTTPALAGSIEFNTR